MPEIVDARLEDYCARWSTPVSPVLEELDRETHLKTLYPQMLTGAWQGRFLTMISQLVTPKRILEVGTFTGYSAICMAVGLAPGGILDTIEVDEEREPMIRRYIQKAQMEDRIHLHMGSALDIIPQLAGPFDLIFLDAHKPDYHRYFDLAFDKISPGGLILSDNVLWSGKVLEADQDEDTRALDAYNQKLARDPRVEQVILPLRDGLSVARKLP
ncbi:MAG: O-methyltransferase [Saprospiraceae bacterium]|nr:O-methyltransferase [Saprospiraceae bacterium]